MTKNKKKNEIRNALNRELDSVRLSDQMKRDILYNAQYSKRAAPKKQTYTYLWAAAAVVILLCASLLVTGTRVRPDTMGKPVTGRPVSAPVAAEGEGTDGNEYLPTPTPKTEPENISVGEAIAAIGETVWTTENGKYYHLVENCSGMENSMQISRNEASLAGKQPCPMCIAFVTPEVVEVTPEPTQMPAPNFFGTENGVYYHIDETCSGMQNAVWLSDLSGKQPCPVCIPNVTPTPVPVEVRSTPEPTETPVYRFYGTENGVYFHIDETCSGMQNAEWLSDLSGKQPCPVCIPYVTPTPMPAETEVTPEPTEQPDYSVYGTPRPTPEPTPVPGEPTEYTYYGTLGGTFFHSIPDCSGMENAIVLTEFTNKLPCHKCAHRLSNYYGTEHGNYYHADKHCSGMAGAVVITELTGKQPCPACILSATPIAMATATPQPIPLPAAAEEITVFWGTAYGRYYHVVEDCSGMKDAMWISRLDGMQPCPACIGNSFRMTPGGRYFHLEEHCSGMENAVAADAAEVCASGKQPCPVCIGSLMPQPTPMPVRTEIPEVIYDAQPTPEPIPVGAEVNAIIGLNRYATDDGCIMELEYAADAEFRFIDEPDTTNWYVDEVESAEYFFEEYLDHRLSDQNIEFLKSAYEKDGKAGYEVKDTLIMLNGVNTEFSAYDGDVPAGKEYRFDDTANPFRECVLYVLDRPFEGDAAEVTVVNRRMLWWFDGEKVYRLTKDHNIVDEALVLDIADGGKIIPVHEKVGFFGLEADAAGYSLGSNHYAIMEYDESLELSDSELISVSGEVFKADMTTDPTFHVTKVIGWRYLAENADYIGVLRLDEGNSSVDVDADSF